MSWKSIPSLLLQIVSMKFCNITMTLPSTPNDIVGEMCKLLSISCETLTCPPTDTQWWDCCRPFMSIRWTKRKETQTFPHAAHSLLGKQTHKTRFQYEYMVSSGKKPIWELGMGRTEKTSQRMWRLSYNEENDPESEYWKEGGKRSQDIPGRERWAKRRTNDRASRSKKSQVHWHKGRS